MTTAALGKYTGQLEWQSVEILCCEEKLTLKIAHPSKLYFWRGDILNEELNKYELVFPSVKELFDAIVEVLSGQSKLQAKIQLSLEEKLLICSFTFFKTPIEVKVQLEREQQSAERMQEHLFNQVSSTSQKVDALERKVQEQLLFETETFLRTREEFRREVGLTVNEIKRDHQQIAKTVTDLGEQVKLVLTSQKEMQIQITKLNEK